MKQGAVGARFDFLASECLLTVRELGESICSADAVSVVTGSVMGIEDGVHRKYAGRSSE